jgi:2'-deoxynucleoside 5'-phosphate N-hydrolase
MTAYISVSFSKRKLIDEELSAIINTLHQHKIEPFIFVDNYEFELTQKREMMQQAMTDINNCDLLIAEVSNKGIGIGIEAGYAKAKNKPIIYIRKKEAEHSTTVSGISDVQIFYSDVNDLQKQLAGALKEIIKTLN